MTTRTVPHTRRRGYLDNRPILWALAAGSAGWLIVYAAYRVLGFLADAVGALTLVGLS